jgi:hypothetical protein
MIYSPISTTPKSKVPLLPVVIERLPGVNNKTQFPKGSEVSKSFTVPDKPLFMSTSVCTQEAKRAAVNDNTRNRCLFILYLLEINSHIKPVVVYGVDILNIWINGKSVTGRPRFGKDNIQYVV